MKLRTLWLAVAATVTLASCSDDPLSVPNVDDPDVARSLSTPDGIEAILRSGFNQIMGATHGSSTALWIQSMILGFENYGSVANFGMNLRATLPRAGFDNQRGNPTQAEHFRDFQALSLRGRNVANAINALDALVAGGGSLGSPVQNLRAQSFGYFALGLANGQMALVYDSVGFMPTGIPSDSVPPLVGYAEAMTGALAQLDQAIAFAEQARTATGSNGFPLPTDWMRTTNATPLNEYVGMLHSMKARLRAGVARTPAEREAVAWAEVEADAAAGITQNWTIELNSAEGWGVPILNQIFVYQGWGSVPNFYIGMADTTSGYANWLGAPLGSRAFFTIVTPDRRFPQGETRAAQQANSPATGLAGTTIYFRNRPTGEDTPGDPYGNSQYDHVRYRHYRTNTPTLTGPWHWMTKAENDLLRAEALIRLGRAADAMPLVNATRVANGQLPAFTNPAGTAPPQPGGGPNSCVPRVPQGGATLACGTLLEAMKWEKRLETQLNGYSQWFIDGRGWGDLAQGTTTMWAVPYQEMDARRKPFYNSQETWKSGPSTYGF